ARARTGGARGDPRARSHGAGGDGPSSGRARRAALAGRAGGAGRAPALVTDAIREEAPAKVNLVLHVGPVRPNGLHEIASLFASLDLHDVVTVERGREADEVVCPGVEGPNLATAALEAFRSHARVDLPPLRVTI